MTDAPHLAPARALQLLLAGNQRFLSGRPEHPNQDAGRRAAVTPGQRPFAVVFGCADSRLAAEIIFDRGLGDLFVVRTAGHVTGGAVLGSIEYAVSLLEVPLIAVLGHDSCGAVTAALQAARGSAVPGGFIREVVERVMLSVLADPGADPEAAVKAHVRHTVALLAERSPLIASRLAAGQLGIEGLYYRLRDGVVEQVAASGRGTGEERARVGGGGG